MAAVRPPLAVMLLLVAGGAALGFLIVEQQLATQSDRWKRRNFLETPVVSVLLDMLLGAAF